MTNERFNKLLDELEGDSIEILKQRNALYSDGKDALHNFKMGAAIDGSTPAQTAWHYMKKHFVKFIDRVQNDDFEDLDGTKEQIRDIMNYLRFIWCIANDDDDAEKFVDDIPCPNCCYYDVYYNDWCSEHCRFGMNNPSRDAPIAFIQKNS